MAARFFQCKIHPNNFCYICGQFVFKTQKRSINEKIRELYSQYFKPAVLGDQDKPWAPHIICKTCDQGLKRWKPSNGKWQMSFAVPMYWMEVRNHEDCYFCKTNVKGFNQKIKKRSSI